MKQANRLKRVLSILLMAVFMTMSMAPGQVEAAGNLLVHFIDVGQGDAILLQSGNTYSLIDTGTESKYSQLSAYLKKINVKKITNLVVTHPDADHMGGADLVIRDYAVKNIYMTTYSSTTNEYKELISAIKKYKVNRVNVKKGQKISMGEVKADVLSANAKASDSNDSSIVLKVVHGKKSFLFTGDISAKLEKQIAKEANVNVDVLKVSHHGSDYSSAITFIKETSPDYAILSVGANNNYGHPDKNVQTRLERYSKNIVRTDKKGTIVLTSTGSKLSCKTVATKTYYSGSSSASGSTSTNTAAKPGSHVYITKTGKKYHAKKCGNGTFTRVSIKDARVKKLTPCSKCF